MKKIMLITTGVLIVFSGMVISLSVAGQEDNNVEKDFLKAVVKGDAERVRVMLRANPALAQVTDEKGRSAILNAAYYRNKGVVEVLLATGIDLNIFEASATGQVDKVQVLITRDPALANEFSPDGFSPLGLAVFFGHRETVKALLDAGADVNAPSRESMKVTPIQSAAAARQTEIAALLIAHGAKANVVSGEGSTPLHEVAANGDLDFAALLIENGADVNAKMSDGKTPLDFALQSGHFEVAAFLRQRGATE